METFNIVANQEAEFPAVVMEVATLTQLLP